MKQLQLNRIVQHYQPKGTFGKQRGSTISQPVKLEGRYEYDFDTGKTTRSGTLKKRKIGDSYASESNTHMVHG